MAPPQGLRIGGDGSSSTRKLEWKIGKLIGSGACASVHELQSCSNSNSNTNFVCKIVPLPTKVTKQKKTLPERNARLIHYEELVYRNQFPEYQGYILPKLPPYIGPPVSGEVNGYKFLVMEKMKGPLWDLVPALLQKKQNPDTAIPIGPIAEQLLTCIEMLHKEKHVVIDVKPENFMLAHSDCNRATSFVDKKASVAQDLARRIRILDLALVAPYKGPEGHRPDDGITEIVGTPLYASLNVHESHTPSRRDDIEALGYVIAEMIIRIVAVANGETAKYAGTSNKKKKENSMPSYLPWSHEPSDAAIGSLKKKQVNNLNSEFYKRMGDKSTATAMKEFFRLTQQTKYKEAPDYAAFRELVSKLAVSVQVEKKKKAATSKTAGNSSKSTTSKSSGRAQRSATRSSSRKRAEATDDSEAEDVSPTKHQKTIDEEHFVDAQEPPEDMDVEVLDMDVEVLEVSSDEETCFHDTQEEEMDWEFIPKENAVPSGKKKPRVGLEIVVLDGPHAGESFALVNGETNAVIIGKNPKATNKQCESTFCLSRDPEADNTHVRLDLKASKQVCSVKISDLKSKSGTVVGSKTLSKGENFQGFINDKFCIGQSTFHIAELASSASSDVPKKASTAKTTRTTSGTSAKKKSPLVQKPAPSNNNAKEETSTAADVLVEVISGPHKGETFALEEGSAEILNIGSAKSVAKKGEPVVLSGTGIEKRHVRLELKKSKIMKVNVTDLSESEQGTLVNNNKIAPKKDQMCFIGDKIKIGSSVLELKLG